MSDFGTQQSFNTNPVIRQDVTAGVGAYMNKVFSKMAIGLLITFAVSFLISTNESILMAAASLVIPCVILQLVVVFAMSLGANKMSAGALNVCFIVYSILTGVTFGIVFMAYTQVSIAIVFIITACIFGGTALYGYVTKKDLTSIGSFAFAALIGIIVMSLINIFLLRSSGFDMAIDIVCVVVFCGLTMYDTQKIKEIYINAASDTYAVNDVQELDSKLAILGALTLYLDFINLFIRLLQIFGREN